MTDAIEHAFLQEILAHPDEDGPRLIYADWLEERGDERCEFIRVQCALARLSPEDPEVFSLAQRERRLLVRNQYAWGRALRRFGARVEFRRGFAEHLTIGAREFLEHGPQIFELAPVRSVHLWPLSAPMAQVAKSQLLERVSALSLRGTNLVPDDARVLFHEGRLKAIRRLDLSENPLRTQGLLALLACPNLSLLEGLALEATQLDDAAMQALAKAPLGRQLRELRLGHNRLTRPAMAALGSSPYLTQLTALDLSGCLYLGDAGVETLAASGNFARLKHLGLRRTGLKRLGLHALLSSQHLTELERLDLSHNTQIDDFSETLFLEPPHFPWLKVLDLSRNAIGPWGVNALCQAERLTALRRLNLSGNPIGDRGAAALAACPHLARLQILLLESCGIGAAGAQALAASPHRTALRELALSKNRLGDAGAQALANFNPETTLELLRVEDNQIAPASRAALEQRFGKESVLANN